MATRQSAALNQQAGSVIYTEAAVTAMLQSLLAQQVSQQSFPAMLSSQAEHFRRLMDQLPQIQASQIEWREPLREAVNGIRSGAFGDADGRLIAVFQSALEIPVTTTSQRTQRNQMVAGLTALRADLAVVRFQLDGASHLYEDAAEMFSDEAAIEPAAWLLESALMAYQAQDSPRALALLGRVVEVSARQIDRRSPFSEWRLLKWIGEVQSTVVQKMAGNQTEALRHFGDALHTEEGLEPLSLSSPEHAYLRWNVRNAALEIYLSQNDIGAARRMLPQMLQIGRAMVKEQGDEPSALEALWASQLMSADMDRFEGQGSKAVLGFTEALGSARRLVERREGSRESLSALRQSLQMFFNLPEETLPAADALTYGREWQRVANKIVQLEPEHLESRRALWDSHKNLIAIQVRMGNPGHALDDAASLLNIAQEMVDDAPGSVQALQALLLSHEDIAKLKWVTGSKVGAMDHYGFAIEAARNRAGRLPNDDVAQADLWRVLVDLGDAQQETGKFGEALENLHVSRNLALSAVEKLDADAKWLERAGYSFLKVATIHGDLGETTNAVEAFARSVAFERRFLERSAGAAGWSYNLWFALSQWGKALLEGARFPEALKLQEASLELAESASKSEASREEAMSCMWFSLREMGETLIKMGELQGGLNKHRAALQMANRQVQVDPTAEQWKSYARSSQDEVNGLERAVR